MTVKKIKDRIDKLNRDIVSKQEEIKQLEKHLDSGKCPHPKGARYQDPWAGECCGICLTSWHTHNLDTGEPNK